MTRKIKFRKWEDPIYNSDNFDDEDEHSPMVITPHGFVSLKLHGSLKNNLKFYEAHTNFDIGEVEKAIIDNTPGINMLDVFSPYTFKFQVGLCFKIKDVVKDLRKRLCGEEKSIFLKREDVLLIHEREMELKETGDMYAIYILPNGKFESFHSSNKEKYKAAVQDYLSLEKNLGGELLLGGV